VAAGGGGWRQWRRAVDERGGRALLVLSASERSNTDTTDFIRRETKYFHGNQ
jgi:hypothetical protein